MLQDGHALFELTSVELAHVDHLFVQLRKLNFLESTVVRDCLINELLKIVLILLEQLDRLNLPHLLHLYVIK